jgi:hypothetical protein
LQGNTVLLRRLRAVLRVDVGRFLILGILGWHGNWRMLDRVC